LKKIKILFFTNIKLHKYLLLIGLASLYSYAGFINYQILYKTHDVGNSLQFSSFLIQAGMLFFMLFGFRLAKKNLNNNLYLILKERMGRIHIFNILFLLGTCFLFVFSLICVFSTYYYWLDPTNKFNVESALFLINYWLLPFSITALIGYIIGINSSNKLIYSLLVIIWALLSPTNLYFLGNLISNTKIGVGTTWLQNINFGVHDLNTPYDPFYGFSFNWYKKIGYLIILIIIFIFSIIFINKKTVRRFNLVLVLISLISISLIPYTTINTYDIKQMGRDYEYYSEKQWRPQEKLFNYDIGSVDLNIENNKKLNVNLKMKVDNVRYSKLAFTLYRGFKVSSISTQNGESLKFIQRGDYTTVDLSSSQGKKYTLNISYSGSGTLSNPANKEGVYLPADFSWIPSNLPYSTHLIFNEHYIANSFKSDSKIKYSLRYKGNGNTIYTNLKQTHKDQYEGKSLGVTLILGDLITQSKGENTLYYPKSWFPYKNDIEDYASKLQVYLDRYNNIFHTNYQLPTKIFLLPNMAINDSLTYINSSSADDYLALQIDPVELTKKRSITTSLPYQIDRAFGNHNKVNNSQEFANWLVFNAMLGSYLDSKAENKNNESTTLKEYQLYLAKSYINEEDTNTYSKLLQMDESSLSSSFFVEWKKNLLDGKMDDWGQLEKLIEIND